MTDEIEELAIVLYKADPESAYNDEGERVEWRYNFAHKERYRTMAQAASEYWLDEE